MYKKQMYKYLYKSTMYIVYDFINSIFFFTVCRNLAGSIDNAATNSVQIGVVADAAACSTACSANANCELWVFFTDTYPVVAQRGLCFLKWNLGFSYPVPAGSTISGAKGCP